MNKKYIFYIVIIFLQATLMSGDNKDHYFTPLVDKMSLGRFHSASLVREDLHSSHRIDLNYFTNEVFYTQKKLPILIISSNLEQRSNSLIILSPKKRELIEQGREEENDREGKWCKELN